MVATVTSALLDQMAAGASVGVAARPSLEVSLFGRASCALRSWLGDPTVEVDLEVVGANEEVHLTESGDHAARLALPLRWVVDVWGRELCVLAGRFSLGVLESTGQQTTLLTVGSDFGSRPLKIESG
jgi:hypothetical protein